MQIDISYMTKQLKAIDNIEKNQLSGAIIFLKGDD